MILTEVFSFPKSKLILYFYLKCISLYVDKNGRYTGQCHSIYWSIKRYGGRGRFDLSNLILSKAWRPPPQCRQWLGDKNTFGNRNGQFMSKIFSTKQKKEKNIEIFSIDSLQMRAAYLIFVTTITNAGYLNI